MRSFFDVWDPMDDAEDNSRSSFWMEELARKHFSKIWNMVPTCLMRLIWREWNTHTFEVTVRFADILKS